jgi:hypothetical protein
VARWRPWKAPHRVLGSASREVRDIPVSAVLDALSELDAASAREDGLSL